jgi:hypothetical protein
MNIYSYIMKYILPNELVNMKVECQSIQSDATMMYISLDNLQQSSVATSSRVDKLCSMNIFTYFQS